jgi:hypothetical protein
MSKNDITILYIKMIRSIAKNLFQFHIVQPTHMQVILVHLIIFAAGLLYSQSQCNSLDRAQTKMTFLLDLTTLSWFSRTLVYSCLLYIAYLLM